MGTQGRGVLCREEGPVHGAGRGILTPSVIGVAPFALLDVSHLHPSTSQILPAPVPAFGDDEKNPHAELTHSPPSHSECVTHQDLLPAAMAILSGNGY